MIKTEAEVKYNRTTRFLLPALRLNDDPLIKMGLVNAYLCDHEYDVRWDYEHCLYILFKPKKLNEEFEDYCTLVRQLPTYKDEYDIEKGVMFVLQIPENYRNIFKPFINGKYSEIDKKYVKECIPQFVGGQLSKRWKIFYKDKSLKEAIESEYNISIGEQEVESKLDIKEEIFRYNSKIEINQYK